MAVLLHDLLQISLSNECLLIKIYCFHSVIFYDNVVTWSKINILVFTKCDFL